MKIMTVGERDVDFSPESSLLLPGRPMFVPELAEGERAMLQPCVAVRINRLGKGISARFAARYHDAMAMAVRLVVEPDPTPGLLSGMDASVYVGEWLDELPAEAVATDGTTIGTRAVTAGIIADALVRISRRTTVKMGDILLFPLPCPSLPIPPTKTHLTLTTPTRTILDVKVV